ncbi:MAG: hypothetical protein WC533_00415 [Candidatus Pacearchaeota archaeon]
MVLNKSKKGQVTVFIIIAVVIVGLLILFFAFTDSGRGIVNRVFGIEYDVNSNLKNCIEKNPQIKNSIDVILSQGGSANPEHAYMHDGKKLEYLCYTNEYYKTCTMQKPLLLQGIEKEAKDAVKDEIIGCINQVEKELKASGYSVASGNINFTLEFVPSEIKFIIDYPITISRSETSARFDSPFEVSVKSNYYDLIMISTSILNYEARFGNSDPVVYMAMYPNIRVEMLKQGDGSTLYYVSDRDSKESFNFAVKSLVFPVGYGY